MKPEKPSVPEATNVRFDIGSREILRVFQSRKRLITRNEFINQCIVLAGPKIIERKSVNCNCDDEPHHD